MKYSVTIYFILIVFFQNFIISQELPEMFVPSVGKLLDGELIDKSIKDVNGDICAGLVIESDLSGLVFNSNNGIVKMKINPGKYLLFLSQDERVVEVYKIGFMPLQIILYNNGIKLEKGKVWSIKVSIKTKKELVPTTIVVTPSDANIFVDQNPSQTNVVLYLELGKHNLVIQKEGFILRNETIEVSQSKKLFIFQLEQIENKQQFNQINSEELTNMVFVPGGKFQMGNPNIENMVPDQTLHNVSVNDFFMDKYEVTNIEYSKFLNTVSHDSINKYINLQGVYNDQKCQIIFLDNMYIPMVGYEEYPVTFVSWYGAKAYASWKNKRLPTEEEWEYAARAIIIPTQNETLSKLSRETVRNSFKKLFEDSRIISQNRFSYSGSNSVDDVAWYNSNADGHVHKVGLKDANELKIFDLTGNVEEWCEDWYDKNYYKSADIFNPIGPQSGRFKVMRGGSCIHWADNCSVFYRDAANPSSTRFSSGFRCVKDIN